MVSKYVAATLFSVALMTGVAGTTTGSSTTTSSTRKWYPDHAEYNATKDQLKAMPEFKY